ncbi:MAG: hypothetical protein ABSC42_15430 [Tepidisphaeraceae bacterium]|jgi:hypothetical protein
MRHLVLSSAAILTALWFIAGCHSGGSDTTTQADNSSTAVAPSAATRPIPPDCIFAKVKMGEERDAVFAAIGQPTSMSGPYQTGKAFIPFHYGGGDDLRMAAHYKGIGIITFGNDSAYTSGYSVVDITYDPSEPGY